MKLSIIIPAYNAANYIETCLKSCSKQDLAISEYEIIVVNDGSTDDTEKLVINMTQEYPNILFKISEKQRKRCRKKHWGIIR